MFLRVIALCYTCIQAFTLIIIARSFKLGQLIEDDGMLFHENRLLADDSHEISYLFFVQNWENVLKFVIYCSRDWRFKD